jgi:hypothetical protein
MNNACPECAAIYTVAEKDIGRRIACKRCATPLVVGPEGLKRESIETGVPVEEGTSRRDRDDDRDRRRSLDDDDDRGRSRSRDSDDDRARRGKGGIKIGKMFSRLKGWGDLATWLYGVGLFFVVYSFFAPVIDKAKIDGRQGYLDEQKQENAILDRKDKAKNNGELSAARKKDQSEFKEKVLDPAEDDLSFASSGKLRAEWWNVMYRVIGFIIISFGSLGFLSPRQPVLQRIVGGGTLLLILLQVIGGGATLNLGLVGRGG